MVRDPGRPCSIRLTGPLRFCHFALFDDELFVPATSVAEALFLFAVASLGFRSLRRRQMSVQYAWMFKPAGPLSWRRREARDPS